MDPVRAQKVLAEYDGLLRDFQQSMGPTQAEARAARHVVDKTKREAAEKRRVHQLQASIAQRNLRRMEGYVSLLGKRSPSAFLRDFISAPQGAKGMTLEGAKEGVRRTFRSQMGDAVRQFSANIVGMRRNKETLRQTTRAIFGESTDDEMAQAVAKAWAEVSEAMRKRFNAAGGHIGKRDDWGLPQAHDVRKVGAVPYREWRDYILPKLDLEAMGRDFNDGVPFTPETIELLMKDAYDAIKTDGYSRRSPSAKHGAAMYNRRADHRFFKFNSADSWLEYNDRFGSGQDPFRIMMGHIDNMSTEIALMEQLGPNPTHGYQFLKDAALQMTARDPNVKDWRRATQATIGLADSMFDHVTGATQVPVSNGFGKAMSTIRQFNVAAMLGSAALSSVTDFNSQRVTAKLAGMGKQGLGYLNQMRRLMSSKEFRNEANRAGLIFENAVDMGNAAQRYQFEDLHNEVAGRLADFTIRASGLGPITEIQRQAFGMEFMSVVASKWRQSGFDELEPATRNMMQQYGITGQDWDLIRSVDPHRMENGLEITRAQDIADATGRQDVADLYMQMMLGLIDYAVPSTSTLGRAAVLNSTKPGTIAGEFMRTVMQFKAFPVTWLVNNAARLMGEVGAGRYGSALKFSAGMFVGATVMGALALQMKEVSKGRDPRDMTTIEFWQAAMLQGGGLGIFGDFLFSDQNRFGGGLAQTLSGPSVGLASDVAKFTVGNAQELIRGEDMNAGRELTNLLRRYTPGGSLWYARLAYERAVLDEIQMVLDPKHRDSFRARMRSAEDYGTQFFAPPGRGLSGMRAPDFENALGG
jgi:hypothetical protein